MSSTSSSECECNEYSTCRAGYGNLGNYGRTPFYPSMGQPLIYYAQVQQPSKRQLSRERRKDNKNCFAKAFKWYTQEHVPYQSATNNTDMNGFAVWLDSKYNEFLQDSQLDNLYHLKVKHTSIIEADRMPTNTYVKPRSKRFRVKSPWRRNLQSSSRKNGDVIERHNQSFHFILQPKDLTRPASECCHPSNATIISTEMPMKTQSYTLISQESHLEDSIITRTVLEFNQTEKYVGKQNEPQNMCCQCSIAKVVKINAQTQYDNIDKETERVTMDPTTALVDQNSQVKLSPSIEATPRIDEKCNEIQAKPIVQSTMQYQCSEKQTPRADTQIQTNIVEHNLSNIQSTSKLTKTCPCESNMEEFKVENLKHFPSPVTFSNNGVQTSDHSICLVSNRHHKIMNYIRGPMWKLLNEGPLSTEVTHAHRYYYISTLSLPCL